MPETQQGFYPCERNKKLFHAENENIPRPILHFCVPRHVSCFRNSRSLDINASFSNFPAHGLSFSENVRGFSNERRRNGFSALLAMNFLCRNDTPRTSRIVCPKIAMFPQFYRVYLSITQNK